MAKMSPELARELFIYEPDTGLLRWKVRPTQRVRIGDAAGTVTKFGYMRVMYRQQSYMVHLVAWTIHYGEWPAAQVDHVDTALDNNRIDNLRLKRVSAEKAPPLTQEHLKEIVSYDPDTGGFAWLQPPRDVPVGTPTGHLANNGYFYICLYSKRYLAHRLAWLYMHGAWPKNQIDHINQVRTDNRFANLRDVTPSQNLHNVSWTCTNRSGVRGVSWDKRQQKWRATIAIGRKQRDLGRFDNKHEAGAAYLAAKEGIL